MLAFLGSEKKDGYVLITAACNEQDLIERTIQTICNQTLVPELWVVVVNDSTDNTFDIISLYAKKYNWIKCINIGSSGARNFAQKVIALETGIKAIDSDAYYQYIGIIDADITLPTNYYETLISTFKNDSTLGIAGGSLIDINERGMRVNRFESSASVPGGIQLFRTECWDCIGGFLPLRWGGEDAIVQIQARLAGWTVKSLRALIGFHNRRTNSAGKTTFQIFLHLGKQDYHIGIRPLFEFFKCLRRILEKPLVIASLLRLIGYLNCIIRREKLIIPDDILYYYNKEQLSKISSLLSKIFQPNTFNSDLCKKKSYSR